MVLFPPPFYHRYGSISMIRFCTLTTPQNDPLPSDFRLCTKIFETPYLNIQFHWVNCYFLLHSILFFISQTSYRTLKIISRYELARPIMGTIFLVYNWASEASPTLGCSIEISRDICRYVCVSVVVQKA